MPVFSNRAVLRHNGKDILSNTVFFNVTDPLSIKKCASQTNYTYGGTIAYIIHIKNSSESSFPAMTVTDDLGAFELCGQVYIPLSFIRGTLSIFTNGNQYNDFTFSSGSTLRIENFTIPRGSITTIVYQTRVTRDIPIFGSREITNTAVLISENPNINLSASCTVPYSGSCSERYTVTVKNIDGTSV